MKRWIEMATVFVTACMALAGCRLGSDSGTPVSPPDNSPGTPIEIVSWKQDDASVYGILFGEDWPTATYVVRDNQELEALWAMRPRARSIEPIPTTIDFERFTLAGISLGRTTDSCSAAIITDGYEKNGQVTLRYAVKSDPNDPLCGLDTREIYAWALVPRTSERIGFVASPDSTSHPVYSQVDFYPVEIAPRPNVPPQTMGDQLSGNWPASTYIFHNQAELAAAWASRPAGSGPVPTLDLDYTRYTLAGLSFDKVGNFCSGIIPKSASRQGDTLVIDYVVKTGVPGSTVCYQGQRPYTAFVLVPATTLPIVFHEQLP